MSVLGTVIKGGLGGFASGGVGGAIHGVVSGIFGGDNGGPNIAKKLSRQVGCTILEKDQRQAKALILKGVDPCTGQSVNPNAWDTGIGNIDTLDPPYAAPGGTPIPVFDPPVLGGGGVPISSGTFVQGNLEFTKTGLIRSVIVGGRRVPRKAAAALIRKHGMDLGARALGLSLQNAARVVLEQSQRPRRRRGITGRQITEARRVMNTIKSMSKALGCSTPRRAPARKTTCR